MKIAGEDKGQTGIVTKVIRSQNRVIVQGLNRVRARLSFSFREGGLWQFLNSIWSRFATGNKAHEKARKQAGAEGSRGGAYTRVEPFACGAEGGDGGEWEGP